ncbi:stabilizer of axonemal microtubules 1-like [Arapaima gigas]
MLPPAKHQSSNTDPICCKECGKCLFPHGSRVTKAHNCYRNEFQQTGNKSSTNDFKFFVPGNLSTRLPKATGVLSCKCGRNWETSYMVDYNAYPIQQNIVRKSMMYRAPTAKMDSHTEYKEKFHPWEIIKRDPFWHQDNLRPSTAKFQTTTTFQDEFYAKPLSGPRHSFKPVSRSKQSAPMEVMTTYREHYVLHPVQPTQPPPLKPSIICLSCLGTHRPGYKDTMLVAPKAAWESSAVPFQSSVESISNHADFLGHQDLPAMSTQSLCHGTQDTGAL